MIETLKHWIHIFSHLALILYGVLWILNIILGIKMAFIIFRKEEANKFITWWKEYFPTILTTLWLGVLLFIMCWINTLIGIAL